MTPAPDRKPKRGDHILLAFKACQCTADWPVTCWPVSHGGGPATHPQTVQTRARADDTLKFWKLRGVAAVARCEGCGGVYRYTNDD